MSARVMNPAIMTEMSSKLSVIVASSGVSAQRVAPSRAALARVRRDLFGPVDHAAARAYAERELRAQSMVDTERWGFDFRLELPRSDANSRFEWQPVARDELVPEPYALRGMPYLRRQSPPSPLKSPLKSHRSSPRSPSCCSPDCSPVSSSSASQASQLLETASTTALTPCIQEKMQISERTPPQEPRLPAIGEKTPDVAPAVAELTVRSTPSRSSCPAQQPSRPSTPSTPSTSARKQAAITDFMKSRKRTLNGSTKSVVEPPEKLSRSTGQIRS